MPDQIVIIGLREFQADLKRAVLETPRALSTAIKVGGEPLVKDASALSPRVTGALAASYRARSAGPVGYITSSVPYGAGAEWGTHSKWSGFAKYGPRGGRFAGRALEDKGEEVLLLIAEGLKEILTIHGWAV